MKKSSSGTATKKKKPSSKRWTLASLFKRRKSKSSDTDCTSSDSECNAKNGSSFLARKRSVRGREGGSHRVVGKFESIIMPREEKPNVSDSVLLENLEQYEASPNATKRGRFNNNRTIGALPMAESLSLSNQEMTRTGSKREPEFAAATGTSTNTDSSHHGSLDTGAGKRLERQRAKARAEAFRQHLLQGAANSSSSEDADYHTAGGGSSNNTSSKTSTSSSLQRTRSPEGSLGRKQQRSTAGVRSADRHSKRQYRECDDLTTAAAGQKARSWDASCRLRTVRKSSSSRGHHVNPVSSYNLHDDYSVTDKGLARRSISWPDNCIRAATAIPAAAAAGSSSRSSAVNSLNSRTKVVNANTSNCGGGGGGGNGGRHQEDKPHLPRSPPPPEFRRSSGTAARNKYSTDKKPRSRNPIQIATESKSSQTCYDDHADGFDSSYFGSSENPDFNLLPAAPPSLNTANELGIPRLANGLEFGRPLSTVMERSDCEQSSAVSHSENDDNFNKNYSRSSSTAAAKKKKPSNLEEALKELEEIYNSLRLSDDELMEAADRRDLSEAIKRNLSRCRYSWSTNLNGQVAYDEEPDGVFFSGSLDCLNPTQAGTCYHRLRLTSNRRSVIPDKVEDDMAYRKLNRKPTSEPKSTSNIVSQSGSFLLVSPTWSPPPFPNLPPPPPSAPPPTTPSSSGASSPSSVNNEPDIMLDDVVYRTITQTNNSLKVADPQPPFGIPIGPLPSATDSDYLHATRKDRYRSSFKPRRTPDIVQDDLAFRTLRKDLTTAVAQNGVAVAAGAVGAQHLISPSRRTRATRSLSANIESDNYRADSITDCNNNRNNGDNIDGNYNGNSDGTGKTPVADSDLADRRKTAPSGNPENDFSAMANEAKIVSRELNEKLRQLNSAVKIQPMCRKELKNTLRKFEAIPSRKKLLEDGDDRTDLNDKNDVYRRKKSEPFVGKIVHHKPITLSQFSIDCNRDGLESNGSIHPATESPSAVPVDRNQSLKSICDSFNWDRMKNVCASPTSNNYETYRVSCTMNVKNCGDTIDANDEHCNNNTDQTKTDDTGAGNLASSKCGNLFPNRALSEASNDLIQSVDNLFRSFIPSTVSQSTTPARSYRNNSSAIVAATPARDNGSSLLTSSAGM